eukprot:844126-Prymnesium_polylepis.1
MLGVAPSGCTERDGLARVPIRVPRRSMPCGGWVPVVGVIGGGGRRRRRRRVGGIVRRRQRRRWRERERRLGRARMPRAGIGILAVANAAEPL